MTNCAETASPLRNMPELTGTSVVSFRMKCVSAVDLLAMTGTLSLRGPLFGPWQSPNRPGDNLAPKEHRDSQ